MFYICKFEVVGSTESRKGIRKETKSSKKEKRKCKGKVCNFRLAGEGLTDLSSGQEGAGWWRPCQVPAPLTYVWWHHGHVLQARFLQHLVHPDVVISHILQSWGHLGRVPQKEGWGGGHRAQ